MTTHSRRVIKYLFVGVCSLQSLIVHIAGQERVEVFFGTLASTKV